MRTEVIKQGGLIRVRRHDNEAWRLSKNGKRDGGRSPAKRGKVTSFSRKSRKRLLDIVASLRKSATRKTVFITLTYGSEWPSTSDAKRHLDTFFKRMARKYPKASALWRMEPQERGAPHFHLLCFRLPYWDKKEVQTAWAEVIGKQYWDTSGNEPREPRTRIELVKSRRGAFYYVGKYLGKQGGFIYRPYLTVGDVGEFIDVEKQNSIGRQWGIHNREHMPFAPIEWLELTMKGYRKIKRYAENVYSLKFEYGNTGFTLYAEPNLADGIYKWVSTYAIRFRY